MDFKGKSEKEQVEELTAALFAEFRFGPGNFSLQLCDQADSCDVLISGLIRAQVVRAGAGESYHQNRASNTKEIQNTAGKASSRNTLDDDFQIAATEVSPIHQVCLAIDNKIHDKRHPDKIKYSDMDKLTLLVLCEVNSGAFLLIERFRQKITNCINKHYAGLTIFREIWAVHRKANPIKAIKLYP